jgi:hypothetical protein
MLERAIEVSRLDVNAVEVKELEKGFREKAGTTRSSAQLQPRLGTRDKTRHDDLRTQQLQPSPIVKHHDSYKGQPYHTVCHDAIHKFQQASVGEQQKLAWLPRTSANII